MMGNDVKNVIWFYVFVKNIKVGLLALSKNLLIFKSITGISHRDFRLRETKVVVFEWTTLVNSLLKNSFLAKSNSLNLNFESLN
jgi:hypothetical protein